MNSEVAVILQRKYEQIQQMSDDPTSQVSQYVLSWNSFFYTCFMISLWAAQSESGVMTTIAYQPGMFQFLFYWLDVGVSHCVLKKLDLHYVLALTFKRLT